MFLGSFKGVSEKYLGCLFKPKEARKFQGCFEEISRVLQGSFMEVSRKFQGCFK